jgi:hypothetical protein
MSDRSQTDRNVTRYGSNRSLVHNRIPEHADAADLDFDVSPFRHFVDRHHDFVKDHGRAWSLILASQV